ncbi:MAG: AMP-binding protein [Elusimicrobia bacterium]|nr:AMP-binding protein [Elusimicrobiota bacterium]
MTDTLSSLLDSAASRRPGRTALLVEEEAPAPNSLNRSRRPTEGYPEEVPPPHALRKRPGRERPVSYAELQGLILRSAALFRRSGIGRGDCVAILHRNGLGFIAAYFGLARIGAAAVPINFMVQKAGELRFLLKDCSAKAVVSQRAFLRELLHAREGLGGLCAVWITDGEAEGARDFWQEALACPPLEGPSEAAAEDTAAVLYTSGTTGLPKGVMLSHANLVSNCDASIKFFRLLEGDVFPCLLPMFHTFAWTTCVLVPLRLGATNLVISSITPPKPWLMRMGRRRATVFVAVPQIYSMLAKQATGLKRLFLRWWPFRGVRFCVSGAGPLPVQVAKDFRRAMGLDILEGYGLTETSPVVSINPPGRARLGSAGLPIEGVRLKIIDGEGGSLPPGMEGEICVAGPCVMKGYLGQPEATRESLSEDGWLKTGDIGLLDEDGYLHIRDRKKDMIIVKGLKVFSAQIENEILSHPDAQEAAVVGVPDDTGDELIKAFVVLKPGAGADKAALMRHCRRRLDAYKRPRDIEIVPDLPKNALQKVLKRVLRQQEIEKRGGPR